MSVSSNDGTPSEPDDDAGSPRSPDPQPRPSAFLAGAAAKGCDRGKAVTNPATMG